MVDFMVFNVGKYTIPMDGMGQDQKKLQTIGPRLNLLDVVMLINVN